MECYIEFGEKNDILTLIFLFVDINVGMGYLLFVSVKLSKNYSKLILFNELGAS